MYVSILQQINQGLVPQSCNRCGECCTKGGDCTFRGEKENWPFEGRCDLLIDNPDGTTTCTAMSNWDPKMLHWCGIRGLCDFPDWRKEIDTPTPIV
jgi:hypothetical protein